MPSPAIFLDRDGTLIIERDYLSDPDQVTLLPTVAESLARLAAAGFALVIVTNQSGIGRGYFTLAQLEAVHHRLEVLLHAQNITLHGIYVCPHAPAESCLCRKPLPELIHRAAAELDLDPARSWVIGDKPADVGLALAVGAGAILVRTGYGAASEHDPLIQTLQPHVADNLAHAADFILGHPLAT